MSTPTVSSPAQFVITKDQLSVLFPDADDDYLAKAAAELNTNPVAFGLDTPLRCAHFFAQVMQETGAGMDAKSENLNYNPAVLKSMFSYYAQHPAEADQDGYAKDASGTIVRPANKEAIGDKAYANRIGNGDVASGDGFRFRGRGFIQVTGRANYAALNAVYAKIYGNDGSDFVANPDLLVQFPYDVRSAVCFWVQHGLPALADHGSGPLNVDAITAVVDRNTDSYAARRANFQKAWPAFQS